MICVAVATFSTPSTRGASCRSLTLDRGRRDCLSPGLVTEPAPFAT
ncbi:hypothetical protein SAMN05216499_1384 [Actinacidiphila paucisporea]|uniref:Uncharacterized protein n=1 Tax=Actinacidiphila paucisporea TaxID=310782 RepID=A0A1M7QMF0_9ACTN|nr:hypothetical protein SAMN05216499_1384 [Actinacidiphila paucisporea]